MELVTGKVGHDHVLSEQAGSMHAGIFGTGTYVLGTGSKLAATMVNANTVRIADGDLMMQGRHCTIAEGQYDDLVVQNGTQNQRRSDLVVARYERLAEEPRTESVSLKVVKGQPSDGEPEDPKIEEGDILGGDLVSEVALYRIPLDGISVGDPKPLFDLLAPMSQIKNELDGLRDSVSQAQIKTGYTSISAGSSMIEFCRVGDIVSMNMYNVAAKISGSWGTTQIGTVPEGFRPKNQLRQRCQVANTDTDRSSGIWVKSSGEMYIANFGGTGLSGTYTFSCTACWPAA